MATRELSRVDAAVALVDALHDLVRADLSAALPKIADTDDEFAAAFAASETVSGALGRIEDEHRMNMDEKREIVHWLIACVPVHAACLIV